MESQNPEQAIEAEQKPTSKISPSAAFGYVILFFFLPQLTLGPLLALPLFWGSSPADLEPMGRLNQIFSTPDFLLASTVIAHVIGIWFLYLLLKKKGLNFSEYLKLKPIYAKSLGIIFLAYVAAAVLIELLGLIMPIEESNTMIDLLGRSQVWLAALAVVVTAPLIEEFFFRGLLFRALEENVSTWMTILLTSLLFGLAHLAQYDIWSGILVICLAFVLGYLRAKWQDTSITVGVHVLNNLVTFLIFQITGGF